MNCSYFTSDSDTGADLLRVMNPDGSQLLRLTHDPADDPAGEAIAEVEPEEPPVAEPSSPARSIRIPRIAIAVELLNRPLGAKRHGLQVARPEDLEQLIEQHDITQVLLAIPSASSERRKGGPERPGLLESSTPSPSRRSRP